MIMAKFKIEYNRPECIGCGACAAVSPDYWEMMDDGKSSIKGGKKAGEKEEKEIEEKDLATNKEAAESCPVDIISIINKDNNEKVV